MLIGGSESDVSDYFLTTHHSRKSLILQLLYIPSTAALDARTIDVNEEVKTQEFATNWCTYRLGHKQQPCCTPITSDENESYRINIK